MKKFSLLFTFLTMFTLILAACGDNDNTDEGENTEAEDTESAEATELAYEPEPIDPDKDVCVVCGMAIADDEHATQIILKNEKSLKYDDIGDMFVWLEENGEDDIGAKFVRDFHTREWIQLEDATFVHDEEISTPMGFGVISFKDSQEAEEYIEENGFGELLSATDLYDHEWKMLKHDHEGGHNHGDGHDNEGEHGHGEDSDHEGEHDNEHGHGEDNNHEAE
ncbi:nitrous oxide reductase accessory protein NosL [Gracilibacillus alcaliphilus]|uniref:nitrous oxide reductase accessory protein NosL n=1 Tax=Gracilibacillus alcaliphilus TaxID=1401441 RepID=UPI00195A35F6|nr:nitrous oxide reductase accessory protein NosL [Gracilibacillus alcaliphilus]MBM7678276.1 copper chaperone NosL [Gracilibacillus alcaliphilus]